MICCQWKCIIGQFYYNPAPLPFVPISWSTIIFHTAHHILSNFFKFILGLNSICEYISTLGPLKSQKRFRFGQISVLCISIDHDWNCLCESNDVTIGTIGRLQAMHCGQLTIEPSSENIPIIILRVLTVDMKGYYICN